MSEKEDKVELEGEVLVALPNATFKVLINEHLTVTAQVSGKMRVNYIRVIPGDFVTVEVSAYDLTRGRITHRGKKEKEKEKDENKENSTEGDN